MTDEEPLTIFVKKSFRLKALHDVLHRPGLAIGILSFPEEYLIPTQLLDDFACEIFGVGFWSVKITLVNGFVGRQVWMTVWLCVSLEFAGLSGNLCLIQWSIRPCNHAL